MIVFGLNRKDVEALLQQPLLVDLETTFGIPSGGMILMLGGETDTDIAAQIKAVIEGLK